jgi:O-methyltransferase/aklanonic acid methyltransferase
VAQGSGTAEVSEQVAQLAERYTKLARIYDRLWSPVIVPYGVRLVARLGLEAAGNVIDVGTGAGALLRVLQDAAPHATVWGVDNSRGMLELARVRHRGPLRVMDVQALALPNDQFDAALVAFVLFHLPAPERCLADVLRILKPGGRIGTATWGGESFPEVDAVWTEELDRAGASTFPLPAVDNRGSCDTEEKVSSLLSCAGFVSIETWTEQLRHCWRPHDRYEYQLCVTSRLRVESLPEGARGECLERIRRRLATATPHDYVHEGEVILATATKP